MLDITLLKDDEKEALEDLSEREWPSVDREHFGDRTIDFTKSPFTLVAYEAGHIVGYVSLMLDMGVLHIESLIVAETFRGQGIGTQLVSAAEAKARSMGAHKAWLETGDDWRAKDLYEKLGYRVCANLRNYYAHRDFVLMDKDL